MGSKVTILISLLKGLVTAPITTHALPSIAEDDPIRHMGKTRSFRFVA